MHVIRRIGLELQSLNLFLGVEGRIAARIGIADRMGGGEADR